MPTASAPTATQALAVGASPRIAWSLWDGKAGSLHVGERVVPRGGSFVLNDGYVLAAGEVGTPGRLALYGWDGSKTLIARWPGTKYLKGTATTDREFAWILEHDDEPTIQMADITAAMLTEERCIAELQFTASKPVPPLTDGDSLAVELLGFVAPGDVAIRARPVSAYKVYPAEATQILRSSGQPAPWPGVGEGTFAVGIVFSLEGRLVAAPESSSGAIRAYDTGTSRALWANIYPASDPRLWLPLGFSASGRRLLLAAGTDLLLVDARTGQPLRRLALPPSADSPAFEDEDHVVFRDDGVREGHREEPHQPAWIVRCSFEGRCERATAPDPADGPDDVRVLAATR